MYVMANAGAGSMKMVGVCFCKERERKLAQVKPLKWRRSIVSSKCLEPAEGQHDRSKIRKIKAHEDRACPA